MARAVFDPTISCHKNRMDQISHIKLRQVITIRLLQKKNQLTYECRIVHVVTTLLNGVVNAAPQYQSWRVSK
jgi:hypothetical protein